MASYKFPTTGIPATNITELVSPLMNQLLTARGITDKKSAEEFINVDYDSQLHAPELLNDIEVACVRIETAMKDDE